MTDAPFLGSTSPLSRQRLRGRAFRRETRDVYVLSEQVPSLELRTRALLVALPDAVASHNTAASLHGLPVPHDPVVHLTRRSGRPMSERPGLRTHRQALSLGAVQLVAGMRVTTPARTFVDLSARLPHVPLVVLGDAVAARWGVDVLEREVGRSGGLRGVVRARAALERVDPGSDSPAETALRLLLHGAGFLGLRHRVEVHDEHGGWVSRPDLADAQARVAVQYDGLVHLERGAEQWRADIDRDELTRAAGWQVVVLTARDLRRPEQAVGKVAAAYARGRP